MSIAPKPQRTLKIMVREVGTGGYSKASGNLRGADQPGGGGMSDAGGECCSRTSQMWWIYGLPNGGWMRSCGLGNVLWNPQQPFKVLSEVVFETNESTSPTMALNSIGNITFTFICAEASNAWSGWAPHAHPDARSDLSYNYRRDLLEK